MLTSGFTNAPVTRLFIFSLVAASILVSVADSKHLFYIQVVPHLWRYKQAWRIVAWQVRSPLHRHLAPGGWAEELLADGMVKHTQKKKRHATTIPPRCSSPP